MFLSKEKMNHLVDSCIFEWKKKIGFSTNFRELMNTYVLRHLTKAYTSHSEIDQAPQEEAPSRLSIGQTVLQVFQCITQSLFPGSAGYLVYEVQRLPEIVPALKSVCKKSSYRYLAAAFLILYVIVEQVGIPVGLMVQYILYPYYLIEYGANLAKESFLGAGFEDKVLLKTVIETIVDYGVYSLAIGGIPVVATVWIKKNWSRLVEKISGSRLSSAKLPLLKVSLHEYGPQLARAFELIEKVSIVQNIFAYCGQIVPVGRNNGLQILEGFFQSSLAQRVCGKNLLFWGPFLIKLFVSHGGLLLLTFSH